MNRFSRGWELFKVSLQLMRQQPKLIWFPIVNTVLTLWLAAFFILPIVVPMAMHPTGHRWTEAAHWRSLEEYYVPDSHTPAHRPLHKWEEVVTSSRFAQEHPFFYAYGVVLYFSSMFLATFFNVAFYSEIMGAFAGQSVSFRRGFQSAWERLPAILMWALLAGGVGWLIRKLEERLPFVGKLIVGLLGVTWSVACVFVIPVIVRQSDARNPLNVLRQSARTLKTAWGETVAGYVGLGAANFMLLLGCMICAAPVILIAIVLHSWILGIASVVLFLAVLICLSYLSGVASQIYRCALYIFAAEGAVPAPYTEEMMDLERVVNFCGRGLRASR